MTSTYAFGSMSTTIVFAVVIAVAATVLLLLTFFSFKYSFRAGLGVYDPIQRTGNRYVYGLDADIAARIAQPYVVYRGESYYMFGNQHNRDRRSKLKKLEVLTETQLAEIFPQKTYKEWLNGGKEEVQNLNRGKCGYKETFEEDNQQVDIVDAGNTDSIPPLVGMSAVKSNTSNGISHISKLDTNNEEVDITEMLPKSKIDYTITATSVPSEETPQIPIVEEKHFTSGICAVCLDDLHDDDTVRGLLCGHVFHDMCIDPWLTKRKGCCPTCKKDLYMEVNGMNGGQITETNTENNTEGVSNSRSVPDSASFNVNDIVHLPSSPPGTLELDQIFSINTENLYSFFVILIITQLEAQTLLVALQYLRNGDYSLDQVASQERNRDNVSAEEEESDTVLDMSQENAVTVQYYANRVATTFEQKNTSETFEVPPIPDLNNLNGQIKQIVEHHPRPFFPADLVDLDYDAWKATKKQYSSIRRLSYRAIGVTQIQLYYHNVVNIYNKNRLARLEGRLPQSCNI